VGVFLVPWAGKGQEGGRTQQTGCSAVPTTPLHVLLGIGNSFPRSAWQRTSVAARRCSRFREAGRASQYGPQLALADWKAGAPLMLESPSQALLICMHWLVHSGEEAPAPDGPTENAPDAG